MAPTINSREPPNKVKLATPQSIADYLARPIQVASGVYGTATTAQSIITTVDAFAGLTDTMWKEKWRGFLNFRATAVFRLTINAMPFQAGLLMLRFVPKAQNYALRTKTVVQISQLPGISFSLTETEAVFRIPYRAPTSFYELNNGFDFGTLILYAYTSMRTAATSASDCDWVIWQSWEDVELETPTLPQMAGVVPPRSSKGIRKLKRSTPVEQEKNEGRGPLSLILGGGSKIAQGLGYIPVLSGVMSSASWFLSAAEGFAHSLGWSKPVVSSEPHRVVPNPHAYAVTADGADMSLPTGMSVDNNVIVCDSMGYTNEDEMSIDYVKTRWSYAAGTSLASYTWAASDAVGAVLVADGASCTVGDFDVVDTVLAGSITYTNCTPIGFLSRLFQLWRGSIILRFRFAKTSYHSGRLMFSYAPGSSSSFGSNQEWLMREIIDLREGDTFCFTLPYCRAQTWLTIGEPSGYWQLTVVNQLRAASTVSSTLDFVVEICGGSDLEFSVPRSSNMAPYYPQMDVNGGMQELDCDVVGSGKQPFYDGECQQTIGETVLSLKQLMLRFSRIFLNSGAGTIVATNGTIQPYYLGGIKSTSAVLAPTTGAIYGDYVSLICSLYAFHRGSMRVRSINDPGMYTQVVTMRSPSSIIYGSEGGSNDGTGGGVTGTVYPFSNLAMNVAHNVFPQNLNAGWMVHVPAYMKNRMRIMRLWFFGTDTDQSYPDVTSLSLSWNTFGTTPSASMVIERAVGDDFQCGLFLGIPPVTTALNGI